MHDSAIAQRIVDGTEPSVGTRRGSGREQHDGDDAHAARGENCDLADTTRLHAAITAGTPVLPAFSESRVYEVLDQLTEEDLRGGADELGAVALEDALVCSASGWREQYDSTSETVLTAHGRLDQHTGLRRDAASAVRR